MGFKRTLRSTSSKITKALTPKIGRQLLGGEENPSVKEQWIIPSFFGDNLFDKSFAWESLPYPMEPPYMACG